MRVLNVVVCRKYGECPSLSSISMNSQGYTVVRFWNNDILANTDGIMDTIRLACLTAPLPSVGEGGFEMRHHGSGGAVGARREGQGGAAGGGGPGEGMALLQNDNRYAAVAKNKSVPSHSCRR